MRLRTKYTQRLPRVQGLVLDIPFFESSGSIAHDLCGQDNHGILTGETWTRTPKGVSLDFNGSSDYVNAGSRTSLNCTNALSIEVGIYNHRLPDYSLSIFLVNKTLANTEAYRMLTQPSSSPLRFRLFTSAGAVNLDSVVTWAVNEWHHVISTYDGASMKVYWDGVYKNQAAQSGNVTTSSDNLDIGYGDLKYYDGLMQGMRVYNKGMTANEVRRRYEQPDYDYCRGQG